MRMREVFTPADIGMSFAADLALTDIGALNNYDFNTNTNQQNSAAFGGIL